MARAAARKERVHGGTRGSPVLRAKRSYGDAGQHQLTLPGKTFARGRPCVSDPNCSAMLEIATTFEAVSRRKSHWFAFTQPTSSHLPFCDIASVPKSPGAE